MVKNCLYCKKPISKKNASFRPFCSFRCKSIDLGEWLEESYQIAGEPLEDTQEESKKEEGF